MGGIPKDNTFITSKFFEIQAARQNVENKSIPEIEEDCVQVPDQLMKPQNDDDDIMEECPICMCFMTEPTQFPAECKHIFCRCCIKTLVQKANNQDANLRCPMCRRPADLKANQNMMQLSEELTSTENKVAFSRQAFNDSVTEYNTYKQTFPPVIFAATFGHSGSASLLEFEDSEAMQEAPKVSF